MRRCTGNIGMLIVLCSLLPALARAQSTVPLSPMDSAQLAVMRVLSPSARKVLIAKQDSAQWGPFEIKLFRATKWLSLFRSTSDVYNDAKLSDNQRAAIVVRDRLLPILRALQPTVASTPAFAGVHLETMVLHQNLVSKDDVRSDEWHVYVSTAALSRFQRADITSQQLLDGSTILINGSRTAVVLAN